MIQTIKKLAFLALSICLFAFTFESCKKSENAPGDSNQASFFKGTVGNTPFTATNVSAAYTSKDSTMDVAASAGQDVMTVGIFHYKIGQTGVFNMSNLQTGGFAHLSGTSYYSKSGTITLTTASATTVAGTFSYLCKDGTNVNGSFSAPVHILP